jgi:membrane protein implicated in regulation of membrane protease activity
MSIFLTFFGLSGIISIVAFPWLGAWSIIPALLVATFITRVSLSAMAWMTFRLNVSNVTRTADLIGLQGKVTIPIEPGGTGQITFAAKGIRRKSVARAFRPEATMITGQHIIIVDMTDKIAIVEPWSDGLFTESPTSIELLAELPAVDPQEKN